MFLVMNDGDRKEEAVQKKYLKGYKTKVKGAKAERMKPRRSDSTATLDLQRNFNRFSWTLMEGKSLT